MCPDSRDLMEKTSAKHSTRRVSESGGASPGSRNRGLQADGPKLPTVHCCTMQFHRELGQKSSFSTTDSMAIFLHFYPPIWETFKGAPTLPIC